VREYKPLRSQVEEALQGVGQYDARIAALEEAVERLTDKVQKILTAERKVRRNKAGDPEGIDIVHGDEVLAQIGIQRGADGRITRAK
jgi:uncharacterized small protein (DUF1192 family)